MDGLVDKSRGVCVARGRDRNGREVGARRMQAHLARGI